MNYTDFPVYVCTEHILLKDILQYRLLGPISGSARNYLLICIHSICNVTMVTEQQVLFFYVVH